MREIKRKEWKVPDCLGLGLCQVKPIRCHIMNLDEALRGVTKSKDAGSGEGLGNFTYYLLLVRREIKVGQHQTTQ